MDNKARASRIVQDCERTTYHGEVVLDLDDLEIRITTALDEKDKRVPSVAEIREIILDHCCGRYGGEIIGYNECSEAIHKRLTERGTHSETWKIYQQSKV